MHPSFDQFGNEFVCIEFSVEAERPPSFVQMPRDVPQEVSAVMPIISQIPKMFPQAKAYSNRLVLFLRVDEWNRLQRKYQYGDDVQIRVAADGSININVL